MKKQLSITVILVLLINLLQAKPVTPAVAKNLAISFYKQHSAKVPQNVSLAYTETSSTGEALYYVFNVNSNDGFVIVTADDAAHPIIAYATENKFCLPNNGKSNIAYWMADRKKEIISLKAAHLEATEAIAKEWAGNFSANKHTISGRQGNGIHTVSTASVAPMLQTTWNQGQYYNDSCPGPIGNKAITGCVATAMGQIMKYWAFPPHGIGSSSYCDCVANGDAVEYGTLTANYGATSYNWGAMQLNATAPDTGIAELMYQCGVSVEMNYSPTNSSSYVLAAGAPSAACAQHSYPTYFGYNANTIAGYQRTAYNNTVNFTDAAWLALIENDLSAGRPVQYAGQDSVQGGHTWVCDGFDDNDYLHMNWGWGGQSNGFYSINNLATTNGSPGFNPEHYHQVLVGIQPPTNVTAAFSLPSTICAASTTPLMDTSAGPPNNWMWKVNPNTGVTISSATDKNPSITFANPGTYTITQLVSNLKGADSTLKIVNVTSCSSMPCDTVSHINNTDYLIMYSASCGTVSPGGYFMGTNCYNFAGLAEAYKTTDFQPGNNQITGAIVLFYMSAAGLGTNGNASDTAAVLSLINDSISPAGSVASSVAITYSNIVATPTVNTVDYVANPANVYSHHIIPYVVNFPSPVALTSNFFLSLLLPVNVSTDSIAIFAGQADHNATNTAWLNYHGGWRQYSNFSTHKYALAIIPLVSCVSNNNTTAINDKHLLTNINVFPNPNNGTFTIKLNEYENTTVEVYNTIGQRVLSQALQTNLTQLSLTGFSNGMYQLRVLKNNTPVYQSKVVKQE